MMICLRTNRPLTSGNHIQVMFDMNVVEATLIHDGVVTCRGSFG